MLWITQIKVAPIKVFVLYYSYNMPNLTF